MVVSVMDDVDGLKVGKSVGFRSAVALRASRALGEGTVASADIVRTFRDAVSAFTMRFRAPDSRVTVLSQGVGAI